MLHDANAPRSFTWHIDWAEGITQAARTEDHGIAFQDARGRTVLDMHAPRAYDANGAAVALRTEWNEATRAFTIALDAPDGARGARLAYPLVVDPEFETSAWFDTSKRSCKPASIRRSIARVAKW